tara:strand:+ start:181 stop:582 length:402 start_codon:yes stop_codon:yes gene_type:complete
MSSFFVKPMIKKARMEVCRDCEFYFKPTGTCKKCGCFMRIKASISVMECPIGRWKKTGETQRKTDIPADLIKEAVEIWEGIKTGTALDQEYKKRAITLYNTIHNTGYNTGTNCSSCLNSVRKGIKKIVDEQNN